MGAGGRAHGAGASRGPQVEGRAGSPVSSTGAARRGVAELQQKKATDIHVDEASTMNGGTAHERDPPEPSRQSIEIPTPDPLLTAPWSMHKAMRLARSFGPAAVVASLSIGAGETILVTGLGAWAEYRLLWFLLLSVAVKGVVVIYLIGRYTAVSGQSVVRRLVELPGPRGWLPLAMVVAEVGLLSLAYTAVGKPCGNLLAHLTQDFLPAGLSFAVVSAMTV